MPDDYEARVIAAFQGPAAFLLPLAVEDPDEVGEAAGADEV